MRYALFAVSLCSIFHSLQQSLGYYWVVAYLASVRIKTMLSSTSTLRRSSGLLCGVRGPARPLPALLPPRLRRQVPPIRPSAATPSTASSMAMFRLCSQCSGMRFSRLSPIRRSDNRLVRKTRQTAKIVSISAGCATWAQEQALALDSRPRCTRYPRLDCKGDRSIPVEPYRSRLR